MKLPFVSRRKYEQLQAKLTAVQQISEFRLKLFRHYLERFNRLQRLTDHSRDFQGRFVKKATSAMVDRPFQMVPLILNQEERIVLVGTLFNALGKTDNPSLLASLKAHRDKIDYQIKLTEMDISKCMK